MLITVYHSMQEFLIARYMFTFCSLPYNSNMEHVGVVPSTDPWPRTLVCDLESLYQNKFLEDKLWLPTKMYLVLEQPCRVPTGRSRTIAWVLLLSMGCRGLSGSPL